MNRNSTEMDRAGWSPANSAAIAVLMLVAGSAFAATPAGVTGNDPEELEEVTVTGSRVITNGNDSPTPVTVLSMDELLQANPGNITAALAQLPSMIGTPTQGGQSGTNFQAVLNLRGMGGARNLVMFDGHRVQSTTTQGGVQTGVDSNLIPTMLLKRVDVVTGGASAVYGSDAISGVINYIVDNNFNGVKVNAQASQTTYNDDRSTNLGIAAGTSVFGGRGHIEGSYQRIYDPGIPDRFSRAWGRQVWSMQGGNTAAAPYRLVQNSRFDVATFGGLITLCRDGSNQNPACTGSGNAVNGPLAGLQFTAGGTTLAPFVHGAAVPGAASVESGGDGAYYTTYPLFGQQKQDLGLVRFDFNVTDDIKAYAEVAASAVINHNPLFNAELRSKTAGYNNPYLNVQAPYAAQIAALATNSANTFIYSRIFTADQMPAPVNDARGRQYLYLAGLDGSWGKYKWNIGLEHGDSSLTNSDPYNQSNARLYAAMNAVRNSGNQIVCNAAIANPSVYGDCVPLNVFGQVNPAAYDYIKQYTYFQVAYHQNDVTASVSGSPIDDWAGPVNMAVSGEWRRQSYDVYSNVTSADPVNCTGIQYNCSPTAPYAYAVGSRFPKAWVTVSELAYEAEVPLLKDAFLAKSLAFNGAVRFTDYSSSGTVWTWKAGLMWAPLDALNFRVTRSRDIRAPTQQQLFAPQNCNNTTFTDIHTQTARTTLTCGQGNSALVPEKADTWTVGLVWKPASIDGFSSSLDFYHIALTHALNSINPTQPAFQAACENSGGTSPLCALFIRPLPYSNATSANFPTEVLQQTLNAGGIWTQGVDWEVDYSHPVFGHNFGARLLTSYQNELTYDSGAGSAGTFWAAGTADSGVAGLLGNPNWKSVLQLNYEIIPNLSMMLQERYRNALKQNGSPLLIFATGSVPPANYTDVNFNYKLSPFGGNMNLFLHVRNLLNRQPDPFAATGANGQVGGAGGYTLADDPIGRFYTAGFNYKF